MFGPVGLFFVLAFVFYGGSDEFGTVANGWAIPTATDIALAWLVARVIFGARHPAVNFLLLLAVADDAIGLVIHSRLLLDRGAAALAFADRRRHGNRLPVPAAGRHFLAHLYPGSPAA